MNTFFNVMKTFSMRYIILSVMVMMAGCRVFADGFTLTGRVVDEENNPIELATVSCMEQGRMVMTDLKGEFSISLSSGDSVVVKFSMVGYNARKRVFRRPKGKLHVEVSLPSMEALGEIVVTEKRPTDHRNRAARHKRYEECADSIGQCRGGTDTATGRSVDTQ